MKNKKKVVWGGVFVFLSVYLFAQSFYGFEGPSVIRAGLSIFLAIIAAMNLWDRDFVSGFTAIGFIGFFNFRYLGFQGGNPWLLLVSSVMMGAGLSMIFKKRRKSFNIVFGDTDDLNTFEEDVIDVEFKTEGSSQNFKNAQDYVRAETTFSDQKRYIRSANFTKADLETNFGNLEVYFQGATFNPEGSIIQCEANFGNITLYLPRTVNVENRLSSTLGSVTPDSVYASSEYPTVVVTGSANFGKISVRYL